MRCGPCRTLIVPVLLAALTLAATPMPLNASTVQPEEKFYHTVVQITPRKAVVAIESPVNDVTILLNCVTLPDGTIRRLRSILVVDNLNGSNFQVVINRQGRPTRMLDSNGNRYLFRRYNQANESVELAVFGPNRKRLDTAEVVELHPYFSAVMALVRNPGVIQDIVNSEESFAGRLRGTFDRWVAGIVPTNPGSASSAPMPLAMGMGAFFMPGVPALLANAIAVPKKSSAKGVNTMEALIAFTMGAATITSFVTGILKISKFATLALGTSVGLVPALLVAGGITLAIPLMGLYLSKDNGLLTKEQVVGLLGEKGAAALDVVGKGVDLVNLINDLAKPATANQPNAKNLLEFKEKAEDFFKSGAELADLLGNDPGFLVQVLSSGGSYYVVAVTSVGNFLMVTISGTDGYSANFNGQTKVVTSTIPTGAAGVTDTITVQDTTDGRSDVRTWTF